MEYKAVIEPVQGLVVQAPHSATVGNVTFTIHRGAEAWSPPQRFWWKVAQVAPPNTKVHIHPRSEVREVFLKDTPLLEYPHKPYAFRAYNNERNNVIRIFVDDSETVPSVMWAVLHEVAHSIVSADPTLHHLRDVKKPKNYAHNDDAHASHPEEQFANGFADKMAPWVGIPKGMDRHWWRKRCDARGYGAPAESEGFPLWAGIAGACLIAYLWTRE